ncbi:hypothetical protein GLOTRDRAFT_117313 [Gloeophyllum trabeum ATCC 11539]|uniref:Six-hairpin glycosidase n=1 Tax=Gloeophyllum trabeum (strain ATCC 11539 / FP-39264 / Madison 617) TaxID=670483 RepID=S7Q1F3_GLOTA|nr:uncharacterized protein GLOTRDRAFT_117313 [Gloeophyllum trabeum ATCC 11539]EPQ53342.1 hypothetical protein GLOTRDRAFT_117313 [Gloeophyllum trabeum ATCC 11539]
MHVTGVLPLQLRQRFLAVSFWLWTCLLVLRASAQDLSDDQLSQVQHNLAIGATHSWELGTRAEALIELNTPSYSVFSSTPLPLPFSAYTYGPPSSLADVLAIAHGVVANQSQSDSPQPFIKDSAAGDPASVGVAVLIANWTGYQSGNGSVDYARAARDQVEYLFSDSVPKTSDGAISHRVDQLQLWSDSVYMVPPFLAYYGVTTGNRSMLEEAYTQCKLYRSYLRDTSANNLWKHVLMGSGTDEGHWSTGNAWAAAGMLRVLRTIAQSQYANTMKHEQIDLANWVGEIHGGMYPHLQSNGLFRNYPDSSDSANFDDAASTALLAATVYRLANAWGAHAHLPDAERSRAALFGGNNDTASNASLAHFTADMWLTPVVNPNSYGQQGSKSPEGQAFVLELVAAHRDWVDAGSQGANAGASAAGYSLRSWKRRCTCNTYASTSKG